MIKPLRYSQHAETVMRERKLDPAWVEAAVHAPHWRRRTLPAQALSGATAPLPPSTGGCCESSVLKRTTKYG